MTEHSQLKFYSLGTVAANKALKSMEIEVVAMEATPMLDGAVTDNTTQLESKATDAMGASYESQAASATTIRATWLPLGQPNRKTAPDVRRGELVAIWQFADQDKYWWMTLQSDLKLRKLETVLFAISGTRDEAAEATADNTYFMEWSTHTKTLQIHTSKADGEPFAYDIQLNAKDGTFVLTDDIGNSFMLDSRAHQITLTNTEGTTVDLREKTLRLFAEDSVSIETKSYQLKCQTQDVAASGSASLKTPANTIEAETAHEGNFVQGGAGGSVGTATFNSTINTTQDVTAQGISLVHHVHKENNSVTDPPAA